jgi:hypothetical protein
MILIIAIKYFNLLTKLHIIETEKKIYEGGYFAHPHTPPTRAPTCAIVIQHDSYTMAVIIKKQI